MRFLQEFGDVRNGQIVTHHDYERGTCQKLMVVRKVEVLRTNDKPLKLQAVALTEGAIVHPVNLQDCSVGDVVRMADDCRVVYPADARQREDDGTFCSEPECWPRQ